MAGSSSARAQKAPQSDASRRPSGRPDAAQAEPVKIDPAAPASIPEGARVRAKASRPTFRRGGLVFNDRDWTVIDAEELGEEAMVAILAEPVLTIQGRFGDTWRTLTAEERGFRISEPAAPPADETGTV